MRPAYQTLEFRIDPRPFNIGAGQFNVLLLQRERMKGRDDRLSVVRPLEVEELAPDRVTELSPTFQLTQAEGQQLADELWRVGFRPTEGAGSAGQMAATERHLEDMRRLVFHKLEAGS